MIKTKKDAANKSGAQSAAAVSFRKALEMKPTKADKKAFSRRFSPSDWGYLCSKGDFLSLFEAGEWAALEACSHKYFSDPHISTGLNY